MKTCRYYSHIKIKRGLLKPCLKETHSFFFRERRPKKTPSQKRPPEPPESPPAPHSQRGQPAPTPAARPANPRNLRATSAQPAGGANPQPPAPPNSPLPAPRFTPPGLQKKGGAGWAALSPSAPSPVRVRPPSPPSRGRRSRRGGPGDGQGGAVSFRSEAGSPRRRRPWPRPFIDAGRASPALRLPVRTDFGWPVTIFSPPSIKKNNNNK